MSENTHICIIEAQNFTEGNLQKFNSEFYPLVVDCGEGKGYAEFAFLLQEPGTYEFYSVYASGENRPVNIYIDGDLRGDNSLGQKTGGWDFQYLAAHKEFDIYLKEGWHRMRIQREGLMPHIKEFFFSRDKESAKRHINGIRNVRIYPQSSKYNLGDINIWQLPQVIYLFGHTSEVHRWGAKLNADDFYKQIGLLKSCIDNNLDYKIIVGVRRTNFYKLTEIFDFLKDFVLFSREELPVFNLMPFEGIKGRFHAYLSELRGKIAPWHIEFEIVDEELFSLIDAIERNFKESYFVEKEMLRALGPVCKDAFIGPRNILLNLSGICNTDCIYCRKFSPLIDADERSKYVKGNQFIDVDIVREALIDAKKIGTENVLIVGEGEPTIYPNFEEVIKTIKTNGMKFNLSTNGMLVDKYIPHLIDDSCGAITVSMSFASRETFRRIRPNTDVSHMDTIERNIRKMVSRKKERKLSAPEIICLHVINKYNYKEIISMYEKTKSLGADAIWFQLVHLGDFSYTALKLSDDEMDEIEESLSTVKRYCNENGIKFYSFIDFEIKHYDRDSGDWSKEGLVKQGCYVGWYFAFLDLRQAVSFCCGMKIVALLNREKRFKELWYSDIYRRFRNNAVIMHRENWLDLYGKPLYDKFCDSCDNHDQNGEMISLLEKYNLLKFVER